MIDNKISKKVESHSYCHERKEYYIFGVEASL